MVVILTDEEAKARAARLRRDHDQLEMLLDRAEKYINQVSLSLTTEKSTFTVNFLYFQDEPNKINGKPNDGSSNRDVNKTLVR